ncbi:hypothetical protein VTN00DRAFT_2340 [Thermoascus crustaceus]|uniref:uncharacterized protein n=1 Tax=Thermoascus crustaceus TaxID=5088 RepID=UPI0037426B09
MDIMREMTEFLKPGTKRWYRERGLPYRRGIALYGPPGTGFPGLDENNLFILFQKLPERCIVLLEDIDEAGISKRGGDISSQPSQDAIDGDEAAKTYNIPGQHLGGSLSPPA